MKEIKCKCGYVWKTKSKLKMVTCPNCGLKVNSEEYKQ